MTEESPTSRIVPRPSRQRLASVCDRYAMFAIPWTTGSDRLLDFLIKDRGRVVDDAHKIGHQLMVGAAKSVLKKAGEARA